MTQGETLFYLREIQSHWSTSNVSRDKLAELEAARLIEINGTPVLAVRLTSEGARTKSLGRPAASNGRGLRLKENGKSFRQRSPRKTATLPKPLV
jgi:hypothetical protein